MKTTYTIRLDVEIDLDPEKPEALAAAGTFMASLSKGDVVAKPEGLAVRVTAGKPKIVNRREDA